MTWILENARVDHGVKMATRMFLTKGMRATLSFQLQVLFLSCLEKSFLSLLSGKFFVQKDFSIKELLLLSLFASEDTTCSTVSFQEESEIALELKFLLKEFKFK